MSTHITKQEMISIWGESFYDECLEEAAEARQKIMPEGFSFEAPIELVLAVAIKKLKDKK